MPGSLCKRIDDLSRTMTIAGSHGLYPGKRSEKRDRVHVREGWFTWISWPGPLRQRRRDVRVRAGMKLKLVWGCTGMCRFAHVGQWASLRSRAYFSQAIDLILSPAPIIKNVRRRCETRGSPGHPLLHRGVRTNLTTIFQVMILLWSVFPRGD